MLSNAQVLTILGLSVLQVMGVIDPSLAKTPQMGWNSWNKYQCNVNETVIVNTANFMVSSGLKDLGYQYINIDDCWSLHQRDNSTQRIVPDPEKFPNGIKGVADKVHALGLKLGIYSDAGTNTCAGYPGSYGYEQIDAQAFSDWGVDYLKYDNCNNLGLAGNASISSKRYKRMGDALKNVSRPIFFSLCSWGQDDVWDWGRSVGGQSWRMSGDISDHWSSVVSIINQEVPIANISAPGGWNDMDMLEVGVYDQMTITEYTSHFSIWAAMKSPMILGNDITNMTSDIKNIITNKEVIAVSQDSLGESVKQRWVKGDTHLFAGPLSGQAYVALFLNEGNSTVTMTGTWSDVFNNKHANKQKSIAVRDLWAHTDLGSFRAAVSVDVEAHGVRMLRFNQQA
ncbi:hypothetical protein INT44_001202 [Umbelopsis vinacea]|uniref:Alpha-galactosidase n=1 Tax=Umbelopsis vinacea TaxID=44442 RepID=A0A8H7QAV1_9FUNG|nr:hypothetical protein INT44_001202 [Umbelopsis vinacea]